MRYTLATGEPVFTGFMRTRPSSTLWAWVYAALYFLQVGWPAWAGTAAAAIFFLFAKRLAVAADAGAIYGIGVAAFLGCVVILTVGRRIERTLELLNWILVVTILGGFFVLVLLFVPGSAWLEAVAGFGGFDLPIRDIRSATGRRRLLSDRSTGRVLRFGRCREHRAVELGPRSWLRHGRARRVHSSSGLRREGACRTHWFHVLRRCQIDGALARMVASGVGRSMGSLLDRRPPRNASARAALRHVPSARHQHSRSGDQRCASVGDRHSDRRRRRSHHRLSRRVAALQDATRQPRRDGARDCGHSLDRKPSRARMARRRHSRGLLHRACDSRRVGTDRDAASPSRSCFCNSAPMWPA